MQKNVAVAKPKRTRAKSVPVAPVRRPVNPPPPAVYALRVWSVKKVNGKLHVSRAARFDDKEAWKGPYDTINRATTAIARKMTEEVTARHLARNKNYGISE
jgi:hypothetical protein